MSSPAGRYSHRPPPHRDLPPAGLLGGVAVLLAWGLFQLRTPNALADLRVSARAPVLLTNLASVAMGFALFASNMVFPQLLELPPAAGGLGLTLLQASLAAAVIAAALTPSAVDAGGVLVPSGPGYRRPSSSAARRPC